jgi:hypothetical protein
MSTVDTSNSILEVVDSPTLGAGGNQASQAALLRSTSDIFGSRGPSR